MKNQIIFVTIKNFEQHNPKSKKGYTHLMLSKRFFDDPKILTLTPHQKLLYLRLLTVCAESASSSIVVHTQSIASPIPLRPQFVLSSLDALKQIQLLEYRLNDPSYIKEKNRIEKNRIEKKVPQAAPSASLDEPVFEKSLVEIIPKEKPKKLSKEDSEDNKKIFDAYSKFYSQRYKIEPLRNATINAQVSSLRKKVGVQAAIELVEFYLQHNNSFYLKNTHSFGLCLKDAETLWTQMQRGQQITTTMVRDFEKTQGYQEILTSLEKDLKNDK